MLLKKVKMFVKKLQKSLKQNRYTTTLRTFKWRQTKTKETQWMKRNCFQSKRSRQRVAKMATHPILRTKMSYKMTPQGDTTE